MKHNGRKYGLDVAPKSEALSVPSGTKVVSVLTIRYYDGHDTHAYGEDC